MLSSRELRLPDGWVGEDIRIGSASVEQTHAEMLEAAGGGDHPGDLWVAGGGNVVSQFADLGLLDEVIVTVVPVVLGGEGKPLFDRPLADAQLQLTGTTTWDSGMVELRYDVVR